MGKLSNSIVDELKSRGFKEMQPMNLTTVANVFEQMLVKAIDMTIKDVMNFCNPNEDLELVDDFIQLYNNEKELEDNKKE